MAQKQSSAGEYERNWKATEAELLRERTFSEQIVNNAPFLIVALQSDGTTDFVNPAVTHVTGYLPEELIGRNWWRLLYPGDSYVQVEQLLTNEENCRVHDYEMILTTKDGRPRTIAWNAVNVLDVRKRPTAIIGLGRDVTDQKQLEEDLRQAQKMEALGRLAGGIAHDFNNLLTIIMGNCDLIDEACGNAEIIRKPLQELRDAASRAAMLTKQLLAFSRRHEYSPQVVDINDLVTGFVPLLTRLLGEEICVKTNLAPTIATVEIDPAQFELILLNLAINARDAMPSGGDLRIATSNVHFADTYATPAADVAPGSYVDLVVSDTGVGMSAGVVKHVFEPFYTTKEVGKGTGMGLATVFGAVKQCNGHITVDSEPGRGSTFHVNLPQITIATSVTGVENDSWSQCDQSPPAAVLIVEDDAPLRQTTMKMLESAGYLVYGAESAEQAMAFMSTTHSSIDLLLTDVVLPGISGVQLADRLCMEQSSVRVILMSGYSPDRILRSEGMRKEWSFISKPFVKRRLLQMAAEALSERRVHSAIR